MTKFMNRSFSVSMNSGSVDQKTRDENWERIFGKKGQKAAQTETEGVRTCSKCHDEGTIATVGETADSGWRGFVYCDCEIGQLKLSETLK